MGPSAGRELRLQFRNKLALPLFTGGKVEGEGGAPIHIYLQDAVSGSLVTEGPEASHKVDILVLEGDFGNDDDEDWTRVREDRGGCGCLFNITWPSVISVTSLL